MLVLSDLIITVWIISKDHILAFVKLVVYKPGDTACMQPVLCALLKQKKSQAFWECPWLVLCGVVKLCNNQSVII